jgi:hypothetical protein
MIVYNEPILVNKFWYFTKFFNKDINTILAKQVLNKFASENKIRVEDSMNIFTEHIVDIANIFKIDMNFHTHEAREWCYNLMDQLYGRNGP